MPRHGRSRRPRRPTRAWPEVEARLGSALPEDFKDLVDAYGGGVLDETIWILEPDCAEPDYDLAAVKEECAEVPARLREAARHLSEGCVRHAPRGRGAGA